MIERYLNTRFRDPVSGLTHLFATLLCLPALFILLQQPQFQGAWPHTLGAVVFGVSMMLLFGASSYYHLKPGTEKQILSRKRLDHMAIFAMIAGTYTPICLGPLYPTPGAVLLVSVWSLALSGMAMKIFWLSAPRWLSTLIYLGMGWLVLLPGGHALDQIPSETMTWLAYGGVLYSLGAVVYATRWPNLIPTWLEFHELWHLFVMGGAYCHFHAIAFGLNPA